MNDTAAIPALTPQDFTSDQEVRWCPAAATTPSSRRCARRSPRSAPRPRTWCSSPASAAAARFPYYMATYGFHTIHGRAPAIATGVKLANPDLDVWVVSGDGDGLSIGGNHTLHALRRNVDLNILLFNNEIYGLTKGQYSPTSREGHALAVDTARLGRPPPVGDPLCARCRCALRRPRRRYRPEAPPRYPEGRARAQGNLLRGNLPELHRLQ